MFGILNVQRKPLFKMAFEIFFLNYDWSLTLKSSVREPVYEPTAWLQPNCVLFWSL